MNENTPQPPKKKWQTPELLILDTVKGSGVSASKEVHTPARDRIKTPTNHDIDIVPVGNWVHYHS